MDRSPNRPEFAADPPNFYEFVFAVALTPEQVEADQHHRFAVDDIDATLEKVQRYIDQHGCWEIILPKTALTSGFVAAVATSGEQVHGQPSDVIFIDEKAAQTTPDTPN